MKLLVETTGPFMVYAPVSDQTVEADRPGVVTPSPFINRAMADHRLRVLHQLADTANDADFLATLRECKGKVDMAVASYSTQHPYDDAAFKADKAKEAAATPGKKPRKPKPETQPAE